MEYKIKDFESLSPTMQALGNTILAFILVGCAVAVKHHWFVALVCGLRGLSYALQATSLVVKAPKE